MLTPRPRLAHRAGHAWEQLVLPLRAARAPALLCPANLAPLAHPRNVIVIHDAAALRHPEWYSPAYAAWQRRILPALARRALHVVTVSEFSRGELTELLGLPADRITRGRGRGRPGVHAGRRRRARAGASSASTRPYVLSVASQTARKNLRALVPLAADVEVVVAGGHRPQFAREEGLEALRHLGAVPEHLLPGLYAGAEAFALPSLYEGFGLPVLEAMACGTPVVASDVTALPETAGGAARLAPPDQVAAAVERPARRRRRAASGCGPPASPARGFTWDRTAREVDAVLRASARSRGSALESLRRRPVHGERAGADELVAAQAPQPGPVERVLRSLAREPRVPDDLPDPQALALSRQQLQRGLRAATPGRSRWSRTPARPPVLPFDAGHESSVSHTGLRPSW